MKKTPLRRIGRVGKANLEANRRLRVMFEGVTECEIKLGRCLRNWLLQFVHRHKRIWYKGDVAKLSDRKQVVIGCQNCHEDIEHDAELTEAVFEELRGKE